MATPELIEILRSEARDIAVSVREWREYLHQNPEPSFHENNTMDFVAQNFPNLALNIKKDIVEQV